MKQTRFYVSLNIVIPVIFSGLASFSAIVAFQIAEEYRRVSPDSVWPIILWILIITVAAFICGLVVVRLLLRPVERFVKRAEQLPVIVGAGPKRNDRDSLDQLERFSEVFDQVADVLSRVEATERFPEIIGQSRAIRGLLSQVMKVAPTDSTVLILGESGTGKELVATSIHDHSLRKVKPIVKLNCVAIPEGLLESELFGHEKGAFTGATAKKQGKFEMAHGGTLFLDEIGDMPLSTQAKILRILQEKEFERVGGNVPIKVDVRFIAATNKNLQEMVKEGHFREDLYYRLNVFAVRVPALRERTEDIPLLVDHFLQRGPKRVQISSSALNALMTYPWPGNVRELQNTVERAAVLCEGGTIEGHHLPSNITKGFSHRLPGSFPTQEAFSLDELLWEFEKGMIVEALERTGGVQVRAAEWLGINQRSLWHRIKKHNIDVNGSKNHRV